MPPARWQSAHRARAHVEAQVEYNPELHALVSWTETLFYEDAPGACAWCPRIFTMRAECGCDRQRISGLASRIGGVFLSRCRKNGSGTGHTEPRLGPVGCDALFRAGTLALGAQMQHANTRAIPASTNAVLLLCRDNLAMDFSGAGRCALLFQTSVAGGFSQMQGGRRHGRFVRRCRSTMFWGTTHDEVLAPIDALDALLVDVRHSP